MLFREVIPEVERVLRGASWLQSGREVTVLRDLDGRVRLMIGPPRTEDGSDPEQSSRSRLENELRKALGPWLGDHTPVWQQPKASNAVADLIVRDRRPVKLEGVQWAYFHLDRHAARHGWVGDLAWSPPWSLAEVDRSEAPPIWVFFSQKGGVGRTTAAAAIASLLARRGFRVLAVDLDLEAPGLGHMLLDTGPGDAGVLDLLTGPEDGLEVRVREAMKDVADEGLVGAGALQVVPAGYVDEDYLRMLARLDLQGVADAQRAVERLHQVLSVLRQEAQPDVILLDARAGFHDVGGIALAALAHAIVFFGRANEQSWHGLRAVARIAGGLSRDEEDEAEVWLQVVHCHAPGRDGSEEHLEFQDRALVIFTEEGYYGVAPPGVADRSKPHFPYVIPWESELRDAGGRITKRQRDVLDRLYSELMARMAGKFGSLRAAAGLPE